MNEKTGSNYIGSQFSRSQPKAENGLPPRDEMALMFALAHLEGGHRPRMASEFADVMFILADAMIERSKQ